MTLQEGSKEWYDYYYGGGIEAEQRQYQAQLQLLSPSQAGGNKPVVEIDRTGAIMAIDPTFRVANNAPLDLPPAELAAWKANHGGSASFFQWTRETYGCPADPLGWNTYVKQVQPQPGGPYGNIQPMPEVEYVTVQTVGLPANYDPGNPHQILVPNDRGIFVAVDRRTWDGTTPRSSDPFEPSPVAARLPKAPVEAQQPVAVKAAARVATQPRVDYLALVTSLLERLLKK